MKVKIKRLHPDAIIPKYAKKGDAGLDLTAVTISNNRDGVITVGTGLAVEIPEGYFGMIVPRSSIYKTNHRLINCVGIIDSGYRGELMFKFEMSPTSVFILRELDLHINQGKSEPTVSESTIAEFASSKVAYEIGDRVGQLLIMPYPAIEFVEGDLEDSDRGGNGFGSSGK
jgi:dUTP pyrophosphatase